MFESHVIIMLTKLASDTGMAGEGGGAGLGALPRHNIEKYLNRLFADSTHVYWFCRAEGHV